MHILLATDADWIVDEVTNALGGDDDTFTVCREGRVVTEQIEEQDTGSRHLRPADRLDGRHGGHDVAAARRVGRQRLPHVPVLMLLDRVADVHLARRCGAEGWLIKPLDSLRLKRAAKALLAGGTYTEGVPVDAAPVEPMVELGDDGEAGRGIVRGRTRRRRIASSVATGCSAAW